MFAKLAVTAALCGAIVMGGTEVLPEGSATSTGIRTGPSAASLEELVVQLLSEPERLRAIPVAPPPYWELKHLLKAALAP